MSHQNNCQQEGWKIVKNEVNVLFYSPLEHDGFIRSYIEYEHSADR